MKLRLLGWLLVASMVAFAGCGGAEDDAGGDVAEEIIVDEFVDDIGHQESIGFLQYGVAAEMVSDELGAPEFISELEMWGADGEYHQRWEYDSLGIQLDMVGDEGAQTVNNITIVEPCDFVTSRDVGIGSTLEMVEEAYAAEIDPEVQEFASDNTIIVGDMYSGIEFTFAGDEVVAIFIGAMAE
jgi:hypothetical protein